MLHVQLTLLHAQVDTHLKKTAMKNEKTNSNEANNTIINTSILYLRASPFPAFGTYIHLTNSFIIHTKRIMNKLHISFHQL